MNRCNVLDDGEGNTKKHSILIVDDDADLRDIIRLQLENEGWTAETAESGNKAIQNLLTHTYDLILSDIRMADGTGLDLLKSVVITGNKTPVVLMTGFSDISKDEALKLGAVAYVPKPFDWEYVRKTILDIVDLP